MTPMEHAPFVLIRRRGKGFRLESEVIVARPRDEVFPFFADARNLERLTPPSLRFRIVSPLPIAMREGALIDYRLRVHGIPIGWRTEIAAWEPPVMFIDEQLRGPYRWWRHQHRFEEIDGMTVMTDIVDYGLPLAWLVHRPLVAPDLRRIFAYRREVVCRIFGGAAALPALRADAQDTTAHRPKEPTCYNGRSATRA